MHTKLTAFTHVTVLDGTREMHRIPNTTVIVRDGKIEAVHQKGPIPAGAAVIDLREKFLLPGLINLHCHLAGNGKPQKIDANTAGLIQQQLNNRVGRYIMKSMTASSAKTALMAGITTIRTVGGLADFDAQVRDEIHAGRRKGPRILSANEAISVPGGHMAGTLALIAHTPEEAIAMVRQIAERKPNLIKLMITGGTLDIEKPGDEGRVLMPPEMIAAAAEEAHRLGYRVAAHVQSNEGIRAALENGVDTIEHGASLDDELVERFKKQHAALISTITPCTIMACLPVERSGLPQLYKDSCEIYMEEIVTGLRRAVKEEIPIGLGIDDGSPYVPHGCMWRELDFFTRYIGTSPEYALWCATGRNAQIADVGDITGTIEPGKSADFLIAEQDPMKDFRHISSPWMVVQAGRILRHPRQKKYSEIETLVDSVKQYDGRYVAAERLG